MNSIYTDAKHFQNETQTQIKFLGNLPLNKYRKAIAERHGFKSIKSFEADLDLITLWVVAYETLGSSGGFDWLYEENDAIETFSENMEFAIEYGTQVALFPFKISKNTKHEDIDELIEMSDYTDYMDKSEISYPYPKNIWKHIINEYNNTKEIPVVLTPEQSKILVDLEKATIKYFVDENIYKVNTNDTETFDNYTDSKSDFYYQKLLASNSGIKTTIIENIIVILKRY
jgi:hypothetical protein